MTPEEHKRIHKKLHKNLDLLLADYIFNHKNPKSTSELTVEELAKWSIEQTINPLKP